LALEACDLPCVAIVRFDNTFVTSGVDHDLRGPLLVRTTLSTPGMAGVAIDVTVVTGGGMTPDHLRVHPPPGYVAEPCDMLVEDNASGQVRVILAPTS
jgi:hypothetical protein